ncbi:hypothetical protein MMC17_007277 [Xylographa soralifera]|nr:hypothetical protein [Xylographa soralifera]
MSPYTSSPLPNPSMSSQAAISSAAAKPAISTAPAVQSIPTSAIAGGCVGGVAIVAIFSAIIFFWWRRRTAKSRKRMSTATGSSSMLGLKTSGTKIPPGMDTFLETKDSPYTDTSPISPTPSHQPFVGFPMDEKLRSTAFHDYRIKPSRSQRSYELPTESSAMAGHQLLQSSQERPKNGLNISVLPTNSQSPMSANPFTHPLYRSNVEEGGTAFRAELDATENAATSVNHPRSFDRQQRRQKPQKKDNWDPDGRL